MGEFITHFLKGTFLKAVSSVQPKNLFDKHFRYLPSTEVLQVFENSKCYDLKTKDVYLVGAGKAVLQMATEVEKVLEHKLKFGIVSIPFGIMKYFPANPNSVIKCYEGADNNIPDEHSEFATKEIVELLKKMNEKCFVIVLLSGGGSALLPLPHPPLTLIEKRDLVKKLSYAGADILELNTVRKKLSAIKGGKLAELAHPAEVLTLLITDIVGDCPDFVASGPTYENLDSPKAAYEILEKYSLIESLSPAMKHVLVSEQSNQFPWNILNVTNFVLANNVTAINTACEKAISTNYLTFNLSHTVCGDVENVANDYCQLVLTLIKILNKTLTGNEAFSIMKELKNIPICDSTLKLLQKLKIEDNNQSICLIAGGEPTVNVKGTGKGGRNQHLALTFSLALHEMAKDNVELNKFDIVMLAAGTDGMDGPTDAAGAIGYDGLIEDANKQGLNVDYCLKNNDSYVFFNKFLDGNNHVKIGHTNTNVMDIHILVIKCKQC